MSEADAAEAAGHLECEIEKVPGSDHESYNVMRRPEVGK
jgi:hypothetical protein